MRRTKPKAAPGDGAVALPPPLKARKTLSGGRAHLAEEKRLDEQRLKQRVDDIGSALGTRPGAATASERIAALRKQVDPGTGTGES